MRTFEEKILTLYLCLILFYPVFGSNFILIYLREIGKQDMEAVDILQLFTVGAKKDAFRLHAKLFKSYTFKRWVLIMNTAQTHRTYIRK